MIARNVWRTLLSLLSLVAILATGAVSAQEDFLDPSDAFIFRADIADGNTLRVGFDVADGYYLYRERFNVTSDASDAGVLSATEMPSGEVKYDPTFEKNMEVYHRELTAKVPLGVSSAPVKIDIAYQGCADAGLCYPPMTHQLMLTPTRAGWQITAHGADGGALVPVAGVVGSSTSSRVVSDAARGTASSGSLGALGFPSGSVRTNDLATGASGTTSSDGMPSRFSGLLTASDTGLAGALEGLGIWRTALVFLVLGALLALTPCVLPMVPILSALVVRDAGGKTPSRSRGLALAASYVAGMSVVYTALGIAAGLSGAGLTAAMQKPWVLALFAGVLVVLALAMFGAFTLQMPSALQSRLSFAAGRQSRGRIRGAAAVGAISALIVGPCVAAPLAGALLYISQTGDVLLGGVALFALSWGMGIPLLLVGVAAHRWLPKAGAWMTGVNRFFGMLLLATAWYIVGPVLPVAIQMVGWGIWLAVAAVMLWSATAGAAVGIGVGGSATPGVGTGASAAACVAGGSSASGASQGLGTLGLFARGAAIVVLLMGAAQVIGAVSGGKDILRPLAHFAAESSAGAAIFGGAQAGKPAFVRVRSLAELDAAVAASTRPVMLDFYADWCVSCHEMERFTFTNSVVAERMGQMTLLQADVTANNADDRALLKRFNLFGPPGIVFYGADGVLQDAPRVIGFQNADRFATALNQVLTR